MKEVMFNFVEKTLMFMWKVIRVILIIGIIVGIIGLCAGELLGIGIVIFHLLILVAGEVFIHGYQYKCPHCKKWSALKKISEQVVGTKDISMLTEVKSRNVKGEVTGTQEQYIPGTRTFYRETFKCKECGKTAFRTYSSDRKNI